MWFKNKINIPEWFSEFITILMSPFHYKNELNPDIAIGAAEMLYIVAGTIIWILLIGIVLILWVLFGLIL